MDASLARKRELLQTLRTKRPSAHEVRLEGEEVTDDRLVELCGARGLFEAKTIVVLDGACESAASREALVAAAPLLESSENAFVVFERGAVDAATAKVLVAVAVKTFRSPAPSVEGAGRGRRDYDPALFALADALGERDKKALWVRYARARLIEGKAPEEIHNILCWQARAMLAASASSSADEAGLKPFVFSKSKRYAARFKPEELRSLAGDLVGLYHDARRGIEELDSALERFILSLV
ncbi:MAG: hypothetical protein U1A28_01195 [Patescibacteria group bacterium]|nr:hypothetical protein [Patescibacteria group bacterium]